MPRPYANWAAFLVMLFVIVGLCGLFASYAGSIPMERGAARLELLNRVEHDGATPELRRALGELAAPVLDGQGPLAARLDSARAQVRDDQAHEMASVLYRTRLMLGIVTFLAAVMGVAILGLVARGAPHP